MPVRFYRTEAGRAPVLDWLRGLDQADRHAIGLQPYASAVRIGRSLVGSLKDGLWEVRPWRLILCIDDIKKTPAEDLALAKRRMKEVTK